MTHPTTSLTDDKDHPVQVLSFDHIGIVVRSLRDAVRLYIDTLGGTLVRGADEDERAMRIMQIRLGSMKIELLQPLSPDCHLHRYLDKFGEGFHHMTLIVADVEASARELSEAGYEIIDIGLDDPAWREAYIRPRDGFGTLIQIADSTRDWQAREEGFTLEDVLSGQCVWHRQDVIRRQTG